MTAPPRRSLSERIVSRMLQSYWRRSRGLSLLAHVCLRAPTGAVLLTRSDDGAAWRLPGGPVLRGEQSWQAARRLLTACAVAGSGAPLRLFAIYADLAAEITEQHVLFVGDAVTAELAGQPRFAFFDGDSLDGTIDAPARRRILEVAGRTEVQSQW